MLIGSLITPNLVGEEWIGVSALKLDRSFSRHLRRSHCSSHTSSRLRSRSPSGLYLAKGGCDVNHLFFFFFFFLIILLMGLL